MQNLLDVKPTMASAYRMVVNYTGVSNEGFLLNALKTLFRLSRVLLDILSEAIKFVSVRSS